jgi:hypothetical protein
MENTPLKNTAKKQRTVTDITRSFFWSGYFFFGAGISFFPKFPFSHAKKNRFFYIRK